eukprot:255027-Chlamydomonas_euryale.AAC.2
MTQGTIGSSGACTMLCHAISQGVPSVHEPRARATLQCRRRTSHAHAPRCSAVGARATRTYCWNATWLSVKRTSQCQVWAEGAVHARLHARACVHAFMRPPTPASVPPCMHAHVCAHMHARPCMRTASARMHARPCLCPHACTPSHAHRLCPHACTPVPVSACMHALACAPPLPACMHAIVRQCMCLSNCQPASPAHAHARRSVPHARPSAHLYEHVHDLVLFKPLVGLGLCLDLSKQLALLTEACHDAQRAVVVDEALAIADDVGVLQPAQQLCLLERRVLVRLRARHTVQAASLGWTTKGQGGFAPSGGRRAAPAMHGPCLAANRSWQITLVAHGPLFKMVNARQRPRAWSAV